MFIAIGFMVLGGVFGFLLRKKEIRNISKIITLLIWILLFILGLEVGSNSQIISSLANIGIEALVITLAAVLGSAIAALLLWKHIGNKKKNLHEE
ncbi:LysO family transporter [Proteiniphilum sp.]|uniref:LysO family transporter n=1 Tax=Proteiniphilum sp. TaxID=1926877 RepID=UPI002B209D8D|nr:LysO family transporter [Proteiniphilum sp.]MEA4918019.1 LysO family transporter [Proteiniphilum sp.]